MYVQPTLTRHKTYQDKEIAPDRVLYVHAAVIDVKFLSLKALDRYRILYIHGRPTAPPPALELGEAMLLPGLGVPGTVAGEVAGALLEPGPGLQVAAAELVPVRFVPPGAVSPVACWIG